MACRKRVERSGKCGTEEISGRYKGLGGVAGETILEYMFKEVL
jgi:hypothetical protein